MPLWGGRGGDRGRERRGGTASLWVTPSLHTFASRMPVLLSPRSARAGQLPSRFTCGEGMGTLALLLP